MSATVPPVPAALVTGSSRGLGRAVARTLAAHGFSVAVHYASRRDAAEESLAACRDAAIDPRQTFCLAQGDVGAEAGRAALFQTALDGLGRIDALINNAGIAPRHRADLTETSEASFDEVLGVNLKGPYFLAQRAARYWMEQSQPSPLPGGFKLLFISSLSATTASLNRGEYCVSKAGLAMVTQLWAARLVDHGVQVFELRPGIMATDMTAQVKPKYDALIEQGLVPMRRWGQPDDLAQAVLAVVQGRFPFSTGEVINIDGGFHLRRL